MRPLSNPFCAVCWPVIHDTLSNFLFLNWSLAGNTAEFGHRINDGRPFWIGNFSKLDRAEVLFYYPADDNWWLGEWGEGT